MEIEYYERINRLGNLKKYAKFNDIEFVLYNKYYINQKIKKRLHNYEYEYYYGKITKGYVVHHIDFNPENNNISNLQLLTNSEHNKIHSKGINNPMYGIHRYGKKSPNYKTNEEMINDVKNNINYKDFIIKYNCSIKIYYRIKKELNK
jgi:hypothetical protein